MTSKFDDNFKAFFPPIKYTQTQVLGEHYNMMDKSFSDAYLKLNRKTDILVCSSHFGQPPEIHSDTFLFPGQSNVGGA